MLLTGSGELFLWPAAVLGRLLRVVEVEVFLGGELVVLFHVRANHQNVLVEDRGAGGVRVERRVDTEQRTAA